MIVTLIAAVSEDGFISRGKGVPWVLPDDRAHFRRYTSGKWLLLGRATFEEMIGWFQPGHHPLLLSRDPACAPPVGRCVRSVQEAIDVASAHSAQELVVCGGAGCYAASMPRATRLVITHVHDSLGEGAEFPRIDPARWRIAASKAHAADDRHPVAFDFAEYELLSAESRVPKDG